MNFLYRKFLRRMRITLIILSIAFLHIGNVQAAPDFQEVFNRSGLVLLLLDPESGQIVQANAAASRFYGYSRERLESMKIHDINIFNAEQIAEEIELASLESRNYFIFRHRLANAEIHTVEVYAYPYQFGERKLIYATVIDVTAQRDLEDALWHHQEQLEETVDTQTHQIRQDSQLKVQILSAGTTLLLLLVWLLWVASRKAVANEKALEEEHRRLADIIEGTHVGTWESNIQTNSFTCNKRWAEIIGYTLEELGPLSRDVWKKYAHPDDWKRSSELLEKHYNGDTERYEIDVRMRHKKGYWVWVHDRARVSSWTSDGKPLVICGTHQDITERKHADDELRKLSQAIEFSSSAVIISDLDGRIEYVNPKFTEISGYQRNEAIGRNSRFLQDSQNSDDDYDIVNQTIASGLDWKGEVQYRRKDGDLYWARDSVSGVENAEGVVTHHVSIHNDITREYELNEQLSYQANHDGLTGLINRPAFERRVGNLLAESVSKQNQDTHALCFMDLDQFKVINDTCGHVAGDELLRQLGCVLQSKVRQSDTLARLGGDEFGILMEHCTLEQSERIADSILDTIRDFNFCWEEQSFRIGISIGLVEISGDVNDSTELLKQADSACYMAKDLGRNRIHVYHTEDIQLARRQGEMQWVSRINQALDENRFCLFAQPIVPIDNSSGQHFEMLLRMLDDKGQIIPPGSFLAAAERYDLIEKLDVWVVRNAFSLIARHTEYFSHVHFVSINLSGKSLTSPEFLEFIISELRKTGIPAHKVCFEVTETIAISNLSSATTFISILKEIGCHFALDDFGSGLSSFGYLKNLPVDFLKIDGMFVKDIVDDPIDHAMVKSINDIGQVMGMQTIAEFVENDAIKNMLIDIGVNYAQGYGVGKPMPIEEMIGELRDVG